MARKKEPSNGFVRRGNGATLGDRTGKSRGNRSPQRGELHTGNDAAADIAKRRKKSNLGTSSLQESLEAIDASSPVEENKESRRRRRKRLRKERNKASLTRRNIKRGVTAILIALAAIAAFLLVRFIITSNSIFDGNLFGLAFSQPLKEDKNGRSNFIIFGTAEDDEGGEHGGAYLTDSLMVLSVNQQKKDAYMLSIPRDLWVDYGQACSAGYQGKINEVYNCGSNGGNDDKAGANALKGVIRDVTGLDVQYYIHLNFTAVVDLVDAVDGVDVKIESNPRGVGILDRNFDWKCGYRCHYVKYEDNQVAHLDGEHALALARARNAQGGYGLSAGNFDREKNQQKIMSALQKKALSVGTLTSVSKVSKILDALGDNLRSDIQTGEVRTLVGLMQEIKGDKIRSLTLVDKDSPLVETGSVGDASVVLPVAGLFNYSDIRAYIQRESNANAATRENAKIAVYNAGGVAGSAQKTADSLSEKGFVVSTVGDAPVEEIKGTKVYQVGDGLTHTAQSLEKKFNIKVIKVDAFPFALPVESDFLIMRGQQTE